MMQNNIVADAQLNCIFFNFRRNMCKLTDNSLPVCTLTVFQNPNNKSGYVILFLQLILK